MGSTHRAPARSRSAGSALTEPPGRPARSRRAWSPQGTTSSSAPCGRTRAGAPERHRAEVLGAAAVDALGWVRGAAGGPDTVVGSGGRALSAAQAQQVALARLVLADPHPGARRGDLAESTPRRHATSGGPWPRVLEGRTVIAIMHRLFSARDADRVAVVGSTGSPGWARDAHVKPAAPTPPLMGELAQAGLTLPLQGSAADSRIPHDTPVVVGATMRGFGYRQLEPAVDPR